LIISKKIRATTCLHNRECLVQNLEEVPATMVVLEDAVVSAVGP
jgi:hypothetical protein